ncbi:three-helix bundle dimerization domain-containing protein [Nocardia sp. NPDC127579]|uniref:three-helix bundle dimerization domain-containing protein n=1 Tax=Nocardia sp. NPDC127579 TaxID=3345402 RepID=UPI0036453D7D
MTVSPVSPSHHQPHDPALDQEAALRIAATRLAEEFDGVADAEAIAGLLRAAHRRLAEHATLDNFLPLLAERYTREFLRAAAERRTLSR